MAGGVAYSNIMIPVTGLYYLTFGTLTSVLLFDPCVEYIHEKLI